MTAPTPEEIALAIIRRHYRGEQGVPAGLLHEIAAALPCWTPDPPPVGGWTGLLLEVGDRPQWVQTERYLDGGLWVVFGDGLRVEVGALPAGGLWFGPIALPEVGQ